jgi:hypothetical protein
MLYSTGPITVFIQLVEAVKLRPSTKNRDMSRNGATTLSITSLSIMALSIMTLSITLK